MRSSLFGIRRALPQVKRFPATSSNVRPVANLFTPPPPGEPQQAPAQLDKLVDAANTVFAAVHSPVKFGSVHEPDDPRPGWIRSNKNLYRLSGKRFSNFEFQMIEQNYLFSILMCMTSCVRQNFDGGGENTYGAASCKIPKRNFVHTTFTVQIYNTFF